jgi:hypothetical protein
MTRFSRWLRFRVPTVWRLLTCVAAFLITTFARGELKTFDGRHGIDRINVRVVYFVPSDRTPLPDWRARVDYFCRRIEAFHSREYQGQSRLQTDVFDHPFKSIRTTAQLRSGDADFIFNQTLGEVDATLHVGAAKAGDFPILLVLSDVNWKPLDDFYRLRPTPLGPRFEGTIGQGSHFPGSPLGGARATYRAGQGVGWGLVSGDGWRVPYRGSDCVVYHEGVGHTIGLPHPKEADDSVMSQGQYHGWLNESWLDSAQKRRLGWKPPPHDAEGKPDLFSAFTAIPDPLVPRPGAGIELKLTWPAKAALRRCQAFTQTELYLPWTEVPVEISGSSPRAIKLPAFDRPTPVSYRVEAETSDGQKVEIWGYFQVRDDPAKPPLPAVLPPDLAEPSTPEEETPELDLLALLDVSRHKVSGDWTRETSGRLVAPKQYGARIELPYAPPDEYRLTAIVEPLDEPNALILGQRLDGHRFLVLVNFNQEESSPVNALENVDGKNFNQNLTAVRRAVMRKGRLSEVVCTVRKGAVEVQVDGRPLLDWRGDPLSLSLSEYWSTPHSEALFLGAYDCRYRFYRVTLTALNGVGRHLTGEPKN